MSKPAVGARVQYCRHNGYFVADIFVVGNVNVIRANGPVHPDNIHRPGLLGGHPRDIEEYITHRLRDKPKAGFWRPDLGVFVVPMSQCRELKRAK